MALALRQFSFVHSLIVVDMAPVSSGLSSEFATFVESMKVADAAGCTKQSMADEILRDGVPVEHYIVSFSTNHYLTIISPFDHLDTHFCRIRTTATSSSRISSVTPLQVSTGFASRLIRSATRLRSWANSRLIRRAIPTMGGRCLSRAGGADMWYRKRMGRLSKRFFRTIGSLLWRKRAIGVSWVRLKLGMRVHFILFLKGNTASIKGKERGGGKLLVKSNDQWFVINLRIAHSLINYHEILQCTRRSQMSSFALSQTLSRPAERDCGIISSHHL